MEEFFKQGDKEQEQGLDFSPLCDRQNTMVPQSQIGKPGSRNSWCPSYSGWDGSSQLQIEKNNIQKYLLCRINPLEALFAGFIDFIVAPTLAVCGDVISLVVGETADQDQVYKPFLALDLSSISDIDCILLISKMCSECALHVLRVCFELHWSCSSEVL